MTIRTKFAAEYGIVKGETTDNTYSEPLRVNFSDSREKPASDSKIKQPQAEEVKNDSVFSMKSTLAHHSTLFKNFNLQAVSTYNYYLEGENDEPTSDQSGSLSSLPRYVTLSWQTAPSEPIKVQPKGLKKSDEKPHPPAATIDVAVGALANGYISPGVISALIIDPPHTEESTKTKLDEDSFLFSKSSGESAADNIGVASSPYSIKTVAIKDKATAVNFIDPSIAGAFEKTRIDVSTDRLHLTVIGSLAKVMGSLEVLSEFNQDVPIQNPPPDFAGAQDSPSVMYVGYIIERYDMSPNGSMSLGRTTIIDNVKTSEFVDRQVAYGNKYSYRIRSIVQWTRSSDVDFNGISTIDRQTAFTSLILPPLASFYAGDWTNWTTTEVVDTVPPEPPDELIVRPVSWKGEIRISWKVGYDPQLDLTSYKLVRSVCNSGKTSDWVEIGTFVVANGSYIDRDVQPYESGNVSYIYAMYSTSYHGVDSLLSEQVEAKLSDISSKSELPVSQIAIKGADRFTYSSGKKQKLSTEIKANSRIKFYCRSASSGHPLRDSTYLVEIRSLSTGERAIVTLNVDATDIGTADA